MPTFRKALLAISAGAVLSLAACKGDRDKSDPLAQDSALSRDLELANRDSAAQPQLQDVATNPPPVVTPPPARVTPAPAPAPRPRRTTPAPEPAPAAPAPRNTTPSGNTIETRSASAPSEGQVGTVAAGTSFGVATGQRICTNTNSIGDRITASLSDPVTASNGVTIPAGATAIIEVTSLKRSESSGDNMQIGLVLKSLSHGGKSYPVNAEVTDVKTETVRAADNNDAAKVIGGAAVGAVLGRVLGGKNKTKGTIIGAAGGAAAGAVLANKTGKVDACVPSGSRLQVRLNSAMQIQSISASDNGI
jgi:hypothetical protein